MMSASFAIEDPMSRASQELRDQGMKGQAKHMFKEMGRNMWTSGKGFAKVGALYSGTECCIEAVSVPLTSLCSVTLTGSTVRRTTSGTLSRVVSSRVRFLRATPARRPWSVAVSRSPDSPPPSTGGSARRLPRSLKRPPLQRPEHKTGSASQTRTHDTLPEPVLDLDLPSPVNISPASPGRRMERIRISELLCCTYASHRSCSVFSCIG